jgi:glutamate racemase
VILACNTASAKALRTLQQHDLLPLVADHRILGVIRPVSEVVGGYSKSGHLGLLATPGTVKSGSYAIEIAKAFPHVQLHAEACPLWVPLVENNELDCAGTDYFVHKHIQALFSRAPTIDTLILGCTHYPLLKKSIQRFVPPGVVVVDQGKLVAQGLVDYLARHPEIAIHCSRGGSVRFFTTDSPQSFDAMGELFCGKPVSSERADL